MMKKKKDALEEHALIALLAAIAIFPVQQVKLRIVVHILTIPI